MKNEGNEANETKLPSAVRCSRVEEYILGDPNLKEHVSKKKEVEIERRDGKKLHFAKEVVDIAAKMMSDGVDPASCSKNEILKHAASFFNVEETYASSKSSASAESATSEGGSSSKDAPVRDHEMNACTPITNLLLGAVQLARLDNNPHADRRRAELDKLVKDYSRYA